MERTLLICMVACGILVYIVGIPAGILCALWTNRKHLHDAASPQHKAVLFTLGGLYAQYEPRFWWFELITLLNKMLMTGALVIAAPGSPVQLLAATLVMLGSVLLVLKVSKTDAGTVPLPTSLSSYVTRSYTLYPDTALPDGRLGAVQSSLMLLVVWSDAAKPVAAPGAVS